MLSSTILTLSQVNWSIGAASYNGSLSVMHAEIINLEVLKIFLYILKDILFALIEIGLIVITLIALFLFLLRRNKNIIIFPFSISKDEEKYQGKTISDILIIEMQRIEHILNNPYKTIESEVLILPTLKLESETTTIPQLGTAGIGSTSISIGELLNTVRGLTNRAITGTLQKYRSEIFITASLTKPSCAWEVHKASEEDCIPELVRDLSYKIVYDLSKGSISARTWEGFKYYSEALNSFGQYERSNIRDIKYLDSSRENCMQAIIVESDYKKTLPLFLNLGIAYYENKNYYEAEILFRKATELDKNESAFLGLGATLGKLERYNEAIKACDEVIAINERSEEAWLNKGNSLWNLRDYDKAINAYEEAIRINRLNPRSWMGKGNAWYGKGKAFEKEEKYQESVQAYQESNRSYDEAINRNPQYPEAWYNKGHALRALKLDAQADVAFANAKIMKIDSKSKETNNFHLS
jgi:tetratricopeptide (TPR) repeat protein